MEQNAVLLRHAVFIAKEEPAVLIEKAIWQKQYCVSPTLIYRAL